MANNKYFIDEMRIPEDLVEAPEDLRSALRTPVPSAPPVPNDMPPFFSGSMPPQLQHDLSFVGTEVGTPRIPKWAVMPLGLQGNPSTNAAVQSTAVISSPAVAPTTGDLEQIFTNPQVGISNYTAQVSDRNELVYLNNAAGGTLVLPGGSYSTLTFDGTTGGPGATASITTPSFTPTLTNFEAGLMLIEGYSSGGSFGSHISFTSGWSPLFDTGGGLILGLNTTFQTSISGSANYSGTNPNWVSGLYVFTWSSLTPPVPVQTKAFSNAGYTGTALFSSNVTKGNEIWVALGGSVPSTVPSFTVTDSQGNTYTSRGVYFNSTADLNGLKHYVALYTAVVSTNSALTVTAVSNQISGEYVEVAFEMPISPILSIPVLPKGWFAYFENIGTGDFTVRTDGAQIDEQNQVLLLPQNGGILAISDGFNYFTFRGEGGGGGTKILQAVLDFGNLQSGVTLLEDTTASVTISATWIKSTSEIFVSYTSGQDHPQADDAAAEFMTLSAGNIVPGVSFDVIGGASNGTWGKYLVNIIVEV